MAKGDVRTLARYKITDSMLKRKVEIDMRVKTITLESEGVVARTAAEHAALVGERERRERPAWPPPLRPQKPPNHLMCLLGIMAGLK